MCETCWCRAELTATQQPCSPVLVPSLAKAEAALGGGWGRGPCSGCGAAPAEQHRRTWPQWHRACRGDPRHTEINISRKHVVSRSQGWAKSSLPAVLPAGRWWPQSKGTTEQRSHLELCSAFTRDKQAEGVSKQHLCQENGQTAPQAAQHPAEHLEETLGTQHCQREMTAVLLHWDVQNGTWHNCWKRKTDTDHCATRAAQKDYIQFLLPGYLQTRSCDLPDLRQTGLEGKRGQTRSKHSTPHVAQRGWGTRETSRQHLQSFAFIFLKYKLLSCVSNFNRTGPMHPGKRRHRLQNSKYWRYFLERNLFCCSTL